MQNLAVVGAPSTGVSGSVAAGAAYIFALSSPTSASTPRAWSCQQILFTGAANANFGSSNAVSQAENGQAWVIIGGPGDFNGRWDCQCCFLPHISAPLTTHMSLSLDSCIRLCLSFMMTPWC